MMKVTYNKQLTALLVLYPYNDFVLRVVNSGPKRRIRTAYPLKFSNCGRWPGHKQPGTRVVTGTIRLA
jgi:hypothetical protein